MLYVKVPNDATVKSVKLEDGTYKIIIEFKSDTGSVETFEAG